MRKICVVTGTRAEYGLLYWTMKAIKEDDSLELQLCVTGMHLSPEFGLTYRAIELDGFRIDKKLEILLSSDSRTAMAKSTGMGVISFAEAFQELKPDVILLLGDRFEVLSAATAAMLLNIPIAHCHGGELTEGAVDESIRHAVTKMSKIHFTSTEIYRKRVIQLGEQPNYVYNVGALGIENIYKLPLLSKEELEKELNLNFRKENIVITYHPATLEEGKSEIYMKALLEALETKADTMIIFTLPNADPESRAIIQLIKDFVELHKDHSAYFSSLGQLRYLSLLQYVDVVVGNSSSGILEAPSFKVSTINIGERQKGRIKAASVLDCEPTVKSISSAFKEVGDRIFKGKLSSVVNPYDKGASSEEIVKILKNIALKKLRTKKFYDVAQ